MLTFSRYDNVSLFKEEVYDFLIAHEVENNLILGILQGLNEDSMPMLMANVRRNDELLIVFLQTHPAQIIISKSGEISDGEMKEIAEVLCDHVDSIPGLIGERSVTMKLSRYITIKMGADCHIKMNQRLYKLSKVESPPSPDGILKKVTMEKLPLITDWVLRFCMETGEALNVEEAELTAKNIIDRGRLHAWQVAGEFVSIANASRPTEHNININFVYTPPEHRKKGYASSCVAALTTVMLDKGFQTTSLYTDLDNPTSNKIYMNIGYKPIMDSVLLRISPPAV